jgi:hypothetical protein
MHPVAREIEVMARVATVEREGLRRLVDHVLDQRAGEAQASVIAEDRTRGGHDLDPAFGACDSPTTSSASSTAEWMRATSASVRGLYCPPLRPGRTGRWSSARGAERRATRAARPPPRRLFLRFDFGRHIRTLSDFGS